MGNDEIPVSENYEGVGVHRRQSAKRRAIVKRAIDRVHDISDLGDLFAVLDDVAEPPEVRLHCGRRILDAINDTSSSRQSRPTGVNLRTVEGIVAALSSNRWRSPSHFGSLLEPCQGQVRR